MALWQITRPDPIFVTHICDAAEAALLVRDIIAQDAEEFGNQFPVYRDDPVAETLRAVEALASKPVYIERYTAFPRDMVYGEPADYVNCVKTLAAIAGHLTKDKT